MAKQIDLMISMKPKSNLSSDEINEKTRKSSFLWPFRTIARHFCTKLFFHALSNYTVNNEPRFCEFHDRRRIDEIANSDKNSVFKN